MKTYILFLLFSSISIITSAQTEPIKWATQETFFEDLEGKELPNFNGLTVNGKPFNSSMLKNQIVILNFWFEKCPPCIAEMPELNKLVNQYQSKVRFIGITYDKPGQAKRFQKRNGFKYEIVSLSPDEIRKLNINHGYPSNILVGKDGKILFAMANASFSDPEFKAKTEQFEEKLKTELEKQLKH